MNGYHIGVEVGDGGGNTAMTALCQLRSTTADRDCDEQSCGHQHKSSAAEAAEWLCEHGYEARIVRGPCPHCGGGKIKRKPWGSPGSKVSRQFEGTNGRDDNVFSGGKHRPLIVSLYPDGRIGLRLVRHKREEFITAATTYRIAAALRAGAEKRKRKAERKARRQA